MNSSGSHVHKDSKFIYSNQSLTRGILLQFPLIRTLLPAAITSLFSWKSSFYVGKVRRGYLPSFTSPGEEPVALTPPSHLLHFHSSF